MSGDQYVWGIPIAGSWNLASNWDDLTTGGAPASAAPDGDDDVTIDAAGGGAPHFISGVGNSATLAIEGPTVLAGQFATGALTLSGDDDASVLLNAGASLDVAGDVSESYGGSLTVDAGGFAVGGNLALSSSLDIGGRTAATIGGEVEAHGSSSTVVDGGSLTIAGDFSATGYASATVASGSLAIGGDVGTSEGGLSLEVQNGGALSIAGALSDAPYSLDEQLGSGRDLSLTILAGGEASIGAIVLDNYDDSFDVDGGALNVTSLSTTANATAVFSVENAGSLSVADDVAGGASEFQISGGAFTVDGEVAGSTLIFAFDGARARLGGLQGSARLTVDGASSLEIGAAGDATTGAIAIDPGVTVIENGVLSAPSVIDNGTIVASGGLSLNGALGGHGQIEIDGGDVTVQTIAANSADAFIFSGEGGVLTLSSAALDAAGTFAPLVAGFDSSDAIDFAGTVGTAAYANGILTLADGAATLARIKLYGDLEGDSFDAVPIGGGQTEIVASASASHDPVGAGPTLAITGASELPDSVLQTLAGTIDAADAGLPIAVYDGATPIGNATANDDGVWTAAVALAGAGPQMLTARATDAADATGVSNAECLAVGGGQTIDFPGGSGNAASLYDTGGDWDLVDGCNGSVYLARAQAAVVGGGDTVDFSDGSGNAASLYDSGGDWDLAKGSQGSLYLAGAQAALVGGGDTVNFLGGSGNAVSLYDTGGDWDLVNGSNGSVFLAGAQAALVGGGDEVDYLGGSGNAASLYDTGGDWDLVYGSDASVGFFGAQAALVGGGNAVNFAGGSGNAASLYDTGGDWDRVNGSDGSLYLFAAQAALVGGGDTVNFAGGSGNAASLYDTRGDWDSVSGSNGSIYFDNARAGVAGSDDTLHFSGTNTVTSSGAFDAFVFQSAIGDDTINGFAPTDTVVLAKSDFASWSALASHLSQSGSNTVISLDASDAIILTGVMVAALTASQFRFV